MAGGPVVLLPLAIDQTVTMKPWRIVPNCKLERMYDGSENWLDKYIEEYKKEQMEETREERSVVFNSESRVYSGVRISSVKSLEVPESLPWLAEEDVQEEPSGVLVDEDEFCGHTGCSFVYNVQDSCLERPSFVMESVPYATYVKLAPLFGMDPYKTTRTDGTNRCKMGHLDEEDKEVDEFIRLVEKEIGVRSDVSLDARVEVGTYRNSVRDDPKVVGSLPENPYVKYLKRTGAGAHAAHARNSLGRRSKEITQMIIKDFLDWYKSIGVEDEETTVDEAILQDLFQIGFDSPTARAIALRIKEMPVVPESLALTRNEPEFAVKKGLKTLVKMDIRLEQQPPKLYAFGRMLPTEDPCLRFQPPQNDVKKTWTECERVPAELESLQVVWEGIENLRSTIAFSNWLKQHPDITPPGYLKEKGLLNINYEEWMQMFKGFEKDIDSDGADLESRPRDLAGESSTILQTRRIKSSKLDQFSVAASSYSLNWKA